MGAFLLANYLSHIWRGDARTIAIAPLSFSKVFNPSSTSLVKSSIGSAPPVNTSWMMYWYLPASEDLARSTNSMASAVIDVWFGGRLKYWEANWWTIGSISTIVVVMPWVMKAAGEVPMPRPLQSRSDVSGRLEKGQCISHK